MYRWDDAEAFDDDVVALGNEAYGALCRGRKHCANKCTDGLLSRAMALLIAPMKVWDAIASIRRTDGTARFAEREAGGAIRLIEYLRWNHSATQRAADRESAKVRIGKHRAANRNAECNGVTSELVTPSETDAVTAAAAAFPLASGSGSGSGLGGSPEGTSVAPIRPDPPNRSQEHVAIALQIRAHDCFRGVDAHHVADHHVGRMQGTGQKLEWAVTAINECAEKKGGLGLNAEAMQGALVGFLKAGRGERREQPVQGEAKSGSAYVEDDDEETLERIRRMPKRVTAQDAAKAAAERKAGGT